MAAKRLHVAGTITRKIPVELIQPDFEVFQSLTDLDLEKLERTPRSVVEIGTLTSGCCQQLVRAVVVRGKVTTIEIEACRKEGSRKAPPDLVEAIRDATKTARRKRKSRPWRPIPVAHLAKSAGRIVDIVTCWRICIFGVCVICCINPGGSTFCVGGGGPIIL